VKELKEFASKNLNWKCSKWNGTKLKEKLKEYIMKFERI
jgi:hypothetical protein